MFLVRSELLRLYMLMFIDYRSANFVISTFLPGVILLKLACATIPTLFIRFELFKTNREERIDLKRKENIQLDDYTNCVTRLEWVLERFVYMTVKIL